MDLCRAMTLDAGFLGLILPHEHLHGCPQPRHLGEAPLLSPGFLLLSLSPPDTSPCCCCFGEKDFRLQCLPGWDALGTTEQEEVPSGKVMLFPNQKSSEQSKWMFIQGVGLILLSCTSISCSGTCSFAPSLHQCSDTVCPALPEQKTTSTSTRVLIADPHVRPSGRGWVMLAVSSSSAKPTSRKGDEC